MCRRITQIFTAHRKVYGSPRIQAELRDEGIRCGRNRIARLMREAHLCARPRPVRHGTTRSDPAAASRVAPNALNREFTAPRANAKWGADVTDIPTRQGRLYLAVVLDLFSRLVVGWAMAPTKDAGLVEQTLRMALGRRHPHADLLHHSDQGSEYTSASYQAVLKSRGIQTEHEPNRQLLRQCGDGAVFGTLKRECPMHFTTHQQARCDLAPVW